MANGSIDLVRAAEARAEETARNAAREAAGILDEANEKAVYLSQQAEDDAHAAAAAKVAAAHEAGAQALEEDSRELESEMDALRQRARARQDEAVRVILEALA